jgi:hypothetical protein
MSRYVAYDFQTQERIGHFDADSPSPWQYVGVVGLGWLKASNAPRIRAMVRLVDQNTAYVSVVGS